MSRIVPILALCIGIILACAGTGERWTPPLVHEQEEGVPMQFCLDCHDAEDETFPYQRYVHTAYFSDNHRRVAQQGQRICAMCHKTNFCDECHGVGIELKPSIKNQTRPDRRMPHTGDYLSRHRIDGRLDPVSCRRCHGNPKASRTCKRCHDIRRKYNLDPQACHDCHGPGTNHALGQDWLDRNSSQFHGNESTISCSDCHELSMYYATCHFDETGSKAPTGSGWDHGNNDAHQNFEDVQSVCNKCHFGVSGSRAPIGSGWIHGFNDDHEHYQSYQSVCNRCHNLNRSYLNDPENCHDCHDD